MLHINSESSKQLLLEGNFGLEMESLRITRDGFLSHTRHPFSLNNKNIVRDFSENQTEINTPVFSSAKAAVDKLTEYNLEIHDTLEQLPVPELLWPFSNPPYIRNEADIPIAIFEGKDAGKTTYRQYLSDRYGRYKMTFSGIHVNYSFNETLLDEGFQLTAEKEVLKSGKNSDIYKKAFRHYKDSIYLKLGEAMVIYGWLLTAVTAASPTVNRSFIEKGIFVGDEFTGMGSVRCSELGYWNSFTPVLDYTSVPNYVNSIQKYVDEGVLKSPSELYYPIRIKPIGENTLENMLNNGISHIEMRMFDLNPLQPEGIDVRDVEFVQLLIAWLASTFHANISKKEQVQAVANFKNAARYDLKTVKTVMQNGKSLSVADAALEIISSLKEFYTDYPDEVQSLLEYQEAKFTKPEKYRYAWLVRNKYSNDFVEKGLQLAKERRQYFLK